MVPGERRRRNNIWFPPPSLNSFRSVVVCPEIRTVIITAPGNDYPGWDRTGPFRTINKVQFLAGSHFSPAFSCCSCLVIVGSDVLGKEQARREGLEES